MAGISRFLPGTVSFDLPELINESAYSDTFEVFKNLRNAQNLGQNTNLGSKSF